MAIARFDSFTPFLTDAVIEQRDRLASASRAERNRKWPEFAATNCRADGPSPTIGVRVVKPFRRAVLWHRVERRADGLGRQRAVWQNGSRVLLRAENMAGCTEVEIGDDGCSLRRV